jgi:hypothetical protein
MSQKPDPFTLDLRAAPMTSGGSEMTNPYITSRIAEQHIQGLLDQAHKSRSRRMTGTSGRQAQSAPGRRWMLLSPVPRLRHTFA